MLLLQSNLFKASLFGNSKEIPITFKYLFMTSSQPRRGRPIFRVGPDGWPKSNFQQCFAHEISSFVVFSRKPSEM